MIWLGRALEPGRTNVLPEWSATMGPGGANVVYWNDGAYATRLIAKALDDPFPGTVTVTVVGPVASVGGISMLI
jgi:hypothetical protein